MQAFRRALDLYHRLMTFSYVHVHISSCLEQFGAGKDEGKAAEDSLGCLYINCSGEHCISAFEGVIWNRAGRYVEILRDFTFVQ